MDILYFYGQILFYTKLILNFGFEHYLFEFRNLSLPETYLFFIFLLYPLIENYFDIFHLLIDIESLNLRDSHNFY